jgi:hypothetical protein
LINVYWQNKEIILKVFKNRNSVLIVALLLPVVVVWSCTDSLTGTINEEIEIPSLTHTEPEQGVTAEDTLFTIVSDPPLNEEQERLHAVIKDRVTTDEIHLARLSDNPGALLEEGRALGLPLSDEKLFVATGERVITHESGNISWVGSFQDQFGSVTLVFDLEDSIGGALRTETVLYKFEPMGDGLLAIIRVDESKFPPEHPPQSE